MSKERLYRHSARAAFIALTIAALLCLVSIEIAHASFEEGYAAYGRRDYVVALRQLRPSAKAGHPVAQTVVGQMYMRGEGVAQDHSEALIWLKMAAEQNDDVAQTLIGEIYDQGGFGIAPDPAEATKWYRLAAELSNATAQRALGMKYQIGNGVPRDHKRAVRWYQFAAEQDYPRAQFELAGLYVEGWGVPKDPTKQLFWNSIACRNPSLGTSIQDQALRATACAYVERLKKELPHEKVEAARKLVLDWVAEHRRLEHKRIDFGRFSIMSPSGRSWDLIRRQPRELSLSAVVNRKKLHTLFAQLNYRPFNPGSSGKVEDQIRSFIERERKSISSARLQNRSFVVTNEPQGKAVCLRFLAVSEDRGVPGLKGQVFILKVSARVCADPKANSWVSLAFVERHREADAQMTSFEKESESFLTSLEFGALSKE